MGRKSRKFFSEKLDKRMALRHPKMTSVSHREGYGHLFCERYTSKLNINNLKVTCSHSWAFKNRVFRFSLPREDFLTFVINYKSEGYYPSDYAVEKYDTYNF